MAVAYYRYGAAIKRELRVRRLSQHYVANKLGLSYKLVSDSLNFPGYFWVLIRIREAFFPELPWYYFDSQCFD